MTSLQPEELTQSTQPQLVPKKRKGSNRSSTQEDSGGKSDDESAAPIFRIHVWR